MSTKVATVAITRWQGSQHPSMSNIMQRMKDDGLRPYMWMNMPNHRYAVRSHNYDKVLYVIDGTVEVTLPDSNQRVILRAGDRIEIPAGVRHGTIIGNSGAKCVEAAKREERRPQSLSKN
jgi:mannose-6-phosphate isomerase-like protein (cupin superfamily)